MIKGIIFDLDGTLVESHLDFAAIKSELGCPSEQDLLNFVEQLPAVQREKAEMFIVEHELADAAEAQWIKGAEHFVEQARARNLPMAIVTRNCQQAAQRKLHNNALNIELVLCREDAPAKPDPTALLQVAAHWQLPVESLIYVGDYLYDVQAARNAGMRSALFIGAELPAYADLADMTFACYSELPDILDWELIGK
jgi:HAD superfamily hydrolase (TIGR01549 family)